MQKPLIYNNKNHTKKLPNKLIGSFQYLCNPKEDLIYGVKPYRNPTHRNSYV